MGRYGILSPGYTGHLNPIIVLGRALQRRGHQVTIISPLNGSAQVQKAGLEYIPIAEEEFPDGEWNRKTARQGELTGLKASRFVGRWLGFFTRGILRDLPGILAREKFDGLVMDQICLGAEAVCTIAGMPLAVAACALSLHAESRVPPMIFPWRYRPSLPFQIRNVLGLLLSYSTGWPITVQLARFSLKNRLPPMKFHHMNEMPPSLVQVAQQPALFDFPRRHLPDHFHYTAPWNDPANETSGDFPWDRLDGRPLIYSSLGTLQNQLPNVFRIIAEACAGFDAQLVLALGKKGAPVPKELPGNPVVVDYAPQLSLLRRATLVITHGGLNTTLESLGHGLPLVVIPIANDQPGVAARVEYLGFGEFIPVRKVTTEGLRHAVEKVLNTAGYRDLARKFASDIKHLDGAAYAAELIETAFKTRQRVTRSVDS